MDYDVIIGQYAKAVMRKIARIVSCSDEFTSKLEPTENEAQIQSLYYKFEISETIIFEELLCVRYMFEFVKINRHYLPQILVVKLERIMPDIENFKAIFNYILNELPPNL